MTTTAEAPTDATRTRRPGLSRNLRDAHTVPRHGPYAAAEWVEAERRWRVSLTAAGRDLVAGLLAKYPAPVTLLSVPFPALFGVAVRAANACRAAAEDLNGAAAAGVCQAATYFDPAETTGTFEAFAGWHVRAAVGRWLRRHSRHAGAGTLTGAEAAPEAEAGEAEGGGIFHTGAEVAAVLGRLSPGDRAALAAAFGIGGRTVRPKTWAARRKLNAALAAAAREASAEPEP